jgi:hypothetical protein
MDSCDQWAAMCTSHPEGLQVVSCLPSTDIVARLMSTCAPLARCANSTPAGCVASLSICQRGAWHLSAIQNKLFVRRASCLLHARMPRGCVSVIAGNQPNHWIQKLQFACAFACACVTLLSLALRRRLVVNRCDCSSAGTRLIRATAQGSWLCTSTQACQVSAHMLQHFGSSDMSTVCFRARMMEAGECTTHSRAV